MDEGPEVRAEGVSVKCMDCDAITEIGVMEGLGDEHNATVDCQGCGERYFVVLRVEV